VVIVLVPAATPVTNPVPVTTVATDVFELDQLLAEELRSDVPPTHMLVVPVIMGEAFNG
jgi:hypothetical protein